jgi:hypothetical protein
LFNITKKKKNPNHIFSFYSILQDRQLQEMASDSPENLGSIKNANKSPPAREVEPIDRFSALIVRVRYKYNSNKILNGINQFREQ